MANVSSRRERKIEVKLEAQMDQLRDSITRLEQENQRLIASNDDLRIKNAELSRENYELKNRLGGNDTDVQAPPPVVADDESKTNTRPQPPPVEPPPPPPGIAFLNEEEDDVDTNTIVGQVVENIKYIILDTGLDEEKRSTAMNGDVLVVYFQVTGAKTKDIYGYSIINHNVLNDAQVLQMIDEPGYIQVYRYRAGAAKKELETAKTKAFVVHNDMTIETPIRNVGPGDIVLWIRTDKEEAGVKRQLESLVRRKLLNQIRGTCSGEICQQTEENVELIAQIIGGQYQEVKPPAKKAPAPFQPRPSAPRMPTGQEMSYDRYVSLIPIPKVVKRSRDFRGGNIYSQRDVYWDYLENGVDAEIKLEYYAPAAAQGLLTISDDGIIRKNSTVGTYKAFEQPTFAPKIYEVTKNSRWEPGVSLKNVASYLLKMIDYFHQILLIPYSSEDFIDSHLDFFYGVDNGKHTHISSPTPPLFDLMEHMYDVRQGFVYIDRLLANIAQYLQFSPGTENSTYFRDFMGILRGGEKRYSKQEAFPEYREFTHPSYIARCKNVLKDFTKQNDPQNPLGKDEKERLYGFAARASLRNYWEAAVVLGLQKEFAFIEPDSSVKERKLTTPIELATGQVGWSQEEMELLPRMVDMQKLPRSKFRFIANWRRYVYQQCNDALENYIYELKEANRFEQTLGHWNYSKDGNRDRLLREMISVVHEGRNDDIIHHNERQKLMDFLNKELIKLTVKVLEERYQMALIDKEESLSFRPREQSLFDQEYFMFKDVVECIKLRHPQWEQQDYRKDHLEVWITGVPTLFMMSSPLPLVQLLKSKVSIHSMSGLEWMVIMAVERANQEFY
tara:strand:- start:38234 stop:40759 length:2526 start_codon:yes stop_codon:yes gene_type:complete